MGKSKAVKQDNIEQLRNELECLKDELDSNESEQIELRSIARYLEGEIQKVEAKLDELDATYE
jgi:predicted nuclease with TOPRIM domain